MNSPSSSGSGLSGTPRMLAIITVLGAAVFGVLAVFDVIPREQLIDYGWKSVAALVILAVASVVIALLTRRG